jgi:phosphatidylserine/phosphatidylglycerophosphate/cardiolipin synthase-like enzyme
MAKDQRSRQAGHDIQQSAPCVLDVSLGVPFRHFPAPDQPLLSGFLYCEMGRLPLASHVSPRFAHSGKRSARVLIAPRARTSMSSHSRYREALLRAASNCISSNPRRTARSPVRRRSMTGSSRSSQHAKTYMTDHGVVYVGSFNLDPRSARLNTEIGVVVENEQLCVALRDNFAREILNVAYRVELVTGLQSGDQHLVWTTREAAKRWRQRTTVRLALGETRPQSPRNFPNRAAQDPPVCRLVGRGAGFAV